MEMRWSKMCGGEVLVRQHLMSLRQMENLGRRESVKTITVDEALEMARFSSKQLGGLK